MKISIFSVLKTLALMGLIWSLDMTYNVDLGEVQWFMARRLKSDGKKWQGVSWWGEITNVQHNIIYNKPVP